MFSNISQGWLISPAFVFLSMMDFTPSYVVVGIAALPNSFIMGVQALPSSSPNRRSAALVMSRTAAPAFFTSPYFLVA